MKFTQLAATVATLLVGITATGANAALHSGDKVAIAVYNHPELSTHAVVDSNGRVSMSLAGAVPARGLEPKQLALALQKNLSRYMTHAAVDVTLEQEGQTVFVIGGPGGTVAYNPGETLASALQQLSLKNPNFAQSAADLHHVRILRDGDNVGPVDAVALTAAGSAGPALHPGDTISLPNKPIAIAIRGEVKQPGMAYLSSDETIADALTQVGGLTSSASSGNFILDRSGTRTQISQGSPEFQMTPQNGDSLIVPALAHINVLGLVGSPGEITLKTDYTLLSAIYYAGAPTRWADLRKVQVIHRGVKSTYDITALTHGNLSQNPALEDGDMVFVPEGHAIDYRGLFQDLLMPLRLIPVLRRH